MDKDKRKLEDRAAICLVFVLPIGVALGGLYAYNLGKQIGKLTLTSEDSAHLPADDPEDANESPNPDGDE